MLKACLNLDDGALSWVMSQILAQKGPIVQEASRGSLGVGVGAWGLRRGEGRGRGR